MKYPAANLAGVRGDWSGTARRGVVSEGITYKLYTPVASGRLPLMNEFRDGEQTCCCTYARRKTVAVLVNLSILGVFIQECPYAAISCGRRSSAIISRTFFTPGGAGGAGVGGLYVPDWPLTRPGAGVAPALDAFGWQQPGLSEPGQLHCGQKVQYAHAASASHWAQHSSADAAGAPGFRSLPA